MSAPDDNDMLSDRDSNGGGGRTSIGSSISGLSRASGKTAPSASNPTIPALLGRGITSMLRTGTEMGDVGDIVLDNMPGSGRRQHHTQWHGGFGSMSAASSMSNTSSRATRSGYYSLSSAQRYLTVPNGPQCGANDNLPAIPNSSSSSSTGTTENRNRDPNRLQPMVYTAQPSYNLPNNRSLTNLRRAHGLLPQSPYVHLASPRAGSGSSTPNNQSNSSSLSDSIGLPSQASQSFEGQSLSIGDYNQTYTNNVHPYSTRGLSNIGQGQLYRGFGYPHNVGQMRVRLPYQSSPQSLQDRREEGNTSHPFGDTASGERSDSLRTSKFQSHRDLSAINYADHRSEASFLPASHKQCIAAKQAESKRFAAGPLSSSSIRPRTNSDALSFDTTAFPISNDGRPIEVLQRAGDIEDSKLKDASSGISNLASIVAASMPVATHDNSTEKTTNQVTSDSNIVTSPERSKEDRLSSVLAGYPGTSPDAPIGELFGNGTPSERSRNVSEYAVASLGSGVESSPFVTLATSDHVQKSLDERSFEFCTSIPDESPDPARPRSIKGCDKYSRPALDLLLQKGQQVMDPGIYSCSIAEGATSPTNVGLQLSSQSYLSRPETAAVGDIETNYGIYSTRSAVIRKLSTVNSTQGHFPCLTKDSCATCTSASSENDLGNSQVTMHLGQVGRVTSVVGVGPRHVSRRSAAGVGPHRNSLAPTRLTDIQEDSIQEDSAADVELSSHRYPSSSGYRPGLRETSRKGPSSQFMLGTPLSILASGDNVVNASRLSTVSYRSSDIDRDASKAFTQSLGLPPMQSSQVGLSDELPGEVGLHHSRSMEVELHASQRLNEGSPPRPAAAGEMRRQRIPLAEVEDVERAALSMQPVATVGLSEMHHACSREVVAESNESTLPSTGRLAKTFSEPSPLLKGFTKRGESAESIIKEGDHHPHATQKPSSACLGPVPGIPHMAHEDDADDELETRGKTDGKSKQRDVSGYIDGGGGGGGGGVVAIGASGAGVVEKLETGNDKTSTQTHHSTAPPAVSSSVSLRRSNELHTQASRYSGDLTLPSSRSLHGHHEAAPLANSQTVPPTVSRRRSGALHNQDPRYPDDFKLPSISSVRSLASRSEAGETHSRNIGTNLPSVGSINTAVDTFLPLSAATGHPPHFRSSHHSNRLSQASTTTAFSTVHTVTASTSRSPADNTVQAPTDQLNSFRLISNQPHEVGERYPTSSLAPPTAIFRDQLCVSDTSDDDLHDVTREARDPLCKRILTACDNTYYKLALRASRGQPSPEWSEPSATQVIQDRAREARDLTASTEAESHHQRHHKTWWQKSSHLIRKFTTRKPSPANDNV